MSAPKDDLEDLASLRLQIAALQRDNAILQTRLMGSTARAAALVSTAAPPEPTRALSAEPTAAQKITLFRSLFRGRTDVYPTRWENAQGKAGYAPACANEWRVGVCKKPRIKCAQCSHRAFLPVTDELIRQHLTGQLTAGVYPLLADDSCHFLAIDFDGEAWPEDAASVRESCAQYEVPAALEISRSGQGAHLWIFFDRAVAAREARALGTALLSVTCARRRVLELSSYDRLFPNQDRLPQGGFGNLIALPLQRGPREHGHSVFVNATLTPWPDQWAYLAGIERMPVERIEPVVRAAVGGAHPLDVAFIEEEDAAKPWQRRAPPALTMADRPTQVRAVLANALYFEKQGLPAALANRLIRLAAFQNPEFYRAQAMRFPVWNKPRVIGCATSHPHHLALPRGCLEAAQALLAAHEIPFSWSDERTAGDPIQVQFSGTLRADQSTALRAVLAHDTGMLVAPTGFGKTVVAAALIARRAVNTLILVHRQDLQRQWLERLGGFLQGTGLTIGTMGGGKSRLTGRLDVIVLQSLVRRGDDDALTRGYGQLIVDECHHLSAVSFEAILRAAPARYVLGLTATPFRRDGLQPILAMQCGPVRHLAQSPADAPQERIVQRHVLASVQVFEGATPIQEILSAVAFDSVRNARIAADVIGAYREGAQVLVLTERTQHVEALAALLTAEIESLIVLHGRLRPRERARRLEVLEAIPATNARVVLATGKLIGEGFDHAVLDTLFLALPISWKGTLQQYAGRLSRTYASKTRVVIHDYVDADIPVLARMARRRALGYRAIGYAFAQPAASGGQQDFLNR